MTGHEFADLIAQYIFKNYESRGIRLYREVSLGKTIIGKDRRVDLFLIEVKSNSAFAIECKFQDTQGTADEKIPYTLDDLEALRVPGCMVYAGTGFSIGILHMMKASNRAAFCLPEQPDLSPTKNTRELDHVLAMQFGWWDLVAPEGKRVSVLKPSISEGS